MRILILNVGVDSLEAAQSMMRNGEICMGMKYLWRRALLVLAASIAGLGLMAAAPTPAAGEAGTVTVTAVAKKNATPPPIGKEDVQVFQGKQRMQVADWTRGESLFLAILIDDSLSSEIANQWNDLRAFINAQPLSAYIAVAYNRNGAAMVAQDFTNDHALAVKALRIPTGNSGAFSSPYLALQDWLKRWPDKGGDRRSIIMITSGVDYFRGGFDPIDPDLDTTIEHAQKQNVNVWTIYYPDAGHVGRGHLRTFNAQGNLSRLSEETGAESYYLGFKRAVSLKPYFDEIHEHLNNQYLLTFEVRGGGKKGKFERVRVTTEIPNVKFLTPSEVFLPASQ
jgi:VWFA-related protein